MTTTPHFPIVLVGCGKMGGAMLGGWLDQGTPAEAIAVVDPTGPVLPAGVTLLPDAAALPPGLSAEVVVLAVKPQVMAEVLPAYGPLVGGDTVVLSVAAGKTIGFFRSVLGETTAVVRAMPNTPAAVGRGMTVLCAGAGVSDAQKARCQTMVEGIGLAAWIDTESDMDAVTAVSGCGPAYVFHMVEAMARAGRDLGLADDLAMTLARQTVAGAGELLFRSPDPAGALRQNVTSPGGVTAEALAVLMDETDGLPPLMKRAMDAAVRRSRDLA
jgi:pyrroline-5-carboxylate reductase